MRVSVCPTMLEPQEVEIHSATSDRVYIVHTPTLFTDGVCDPECKGYMFRRDCRHIQEAVEQAVCFWGSNDPNMTHCPKCGREAISVIIPEPERKRAT